jgi:serine/threonine protein kinase
VIAAAHGAGVTRYDVLGRLAVGGMAEIFLARAAGLEGFAKYVVVKRMLPDVARRKEMVAMFLDEARITARLRHQNIAQIYDFGLIDESYFFTMEYLHGRDLRAVMAKTTDRNERLPLQHGLTIVCGAAQGLHHAHEAVDDDGVSLEIVHRDVSLSNIVVTFDGGVKMVDFGVAKARSRSTETRAGGLKGKIAYMSPEQCLGDPVDRRSDVFALGVVLYELTTSTRLFKIPGGDAEFKIMQRIVYDEIQPPSLRVEDYPAALETIVMRALSKRPADRYPTAQDLQVDLEQFAAASGMPLSTVMLSRYVKALFGDAAEPWRRLPTETSSPGTEHTISITGEPLTLDADAPFALVTRAQDAVDGVLRWQAAPAAVPPTETVDTMAATTIGPPPQIPIHEQETRIDMETSVSLRPVPVWMRAWRWLRTWWVMRASPWLRSLWRRRPVWLTPRIAAGAAGVIVLGVIIGFIVSGDDQPAAKPPEPEPEPEPVLAPPASPPIVEPAARPVPPPIVEPPAPEPVVEPPAPTPIEEPAAKPAKRRRPAKPITDLERRVKERESDEWKPVKRSR